MGIKQKKAIKVPIEMLINLLVCHMQKTDQRSDHSASDQGSVQANMLSAAKSKDQGKTITI